MQLKGLGVCNTYFWIPPIGKSDGVVSSRRTSVSIERPQSRACSNMPPRALRAPSELYSVAEGGRESPSLWRQRLTASQGKGGGRSRNSMCHDRPLFLNGQRPIKSFLKPSVVNSRCAWRCHPCFVALTIQLTGLHRGLLS